MLNYAASINPSLWQVLEIIFIGEHWKMGRKRQQPGMFVSVKYRNLFSEAFKMAVSALNLTIEKSLH